MLFIDRTLVASAFFMACFFSVAVHADGGIVLGGTRVIYSATQKESSISVRNSSDTSRYMVQSWIDNQHGDKTSDFVVTPPLYISNPGSENILRLMYVGSPLPSDRETLFYLIVKAIPAIDKKETIGKNVLMLSAATRIKLFVRPAGLKPSPSEAPSRLQVSVIGDQALIKNPTPYYITIVKIKSGTRALNESMMVPPFSEENLKLPSDKTDKLSFRTVNDFGGFSDEKVWQF
ncbi:fimbria/pilus periplasmic chaperone [Citrobacter amalonaticus]|uniref:fimbria/pilus periplasmic chaperone n=1 Tax=Citrobacter amalonaticus TaxID=35703 RepID=UPI0019044860|nr:fimbria/pilus periplasmic chaperone [Citrobacter amalonaticus]MBJ9260674.1 fimbria/pilus periplasmic chaperone [Citrobacter amalonaticus]